jgi:hypothetical protein
VSGSLRLRIPPGTAEVLHRCPVATRPDPRIARGFLNRHAVCVADPLIERAEVVALLFNVSDIAVTLTKIERLLGEDDGEEEADEG